MPYYQRTGMISHRHPFYDSDDTLIVEEDMPVVEPEPQIVAPAPAPAPAGSQVVAPVMSTPITIGSAVLSAAEVAVLTAIWRRPGAKTWPWYVLAGFVGLRAVGSIVKLAQLAR